MARNKSLALSILAVSILAGCTNVPVFHDGGKPQVVAAPDKVSIMLAESADRASNALQTLAAVEQARAPTAQVGNVGQAPAELRRAISVNWIGPVEPITKTLAERAGYQFLTIGAPPPVPVVVSVDVENRPVIDVLRDIGLQLGVRGDVKVDAGRRMVEIHYPPTTGIGG
ncbi:MAG: DotD/TraH family lipoprotein [Micavibrio sp.]|nr:DotD/TraH family lipoprotein [Micavibrio sp.]